jgi:hypothetical protein
MTNFCLQVKRCVQMSAVSPFLSSLHSLLPFLEVAPAHQAYLVRRLRQLSAGGAMGVYKWNCGDRADDGSDWSAKYPADAELVMHCVACYLDCRLPPVKGVVDGSVFSSIFYLKEGQDAASKAAAAIKPKVCHFQHLSL